MEAFTTLTAIAAPMPKPNINTDDIYPAAGASAVARNMPAEAFGSQKHAGANAFSALRYDDNCAPIPDFILNQAPYDQAKIIVGGPNFGCGSSREMAVWAIAGIGVRSVIAASFGDIFFNNCFKNSVLPIRLPQGEVEELLAMVSDPAKSTVTVDLRAKTVTGADRKARPFEVAAYYREALLGGLDEIAATSKRLDRIEAFDRAYRAERPWLTF